MKRRLAAILAADVVGYSRLMAEDEVGTLAALNQHRRDLFDPETTKRGGRTVKLMGDGTLVEFSSVIDAVEAALAIQQALAAGDAPIKLRIGINLGDVIIEGDDIYGDGVNIAARLEALAEPGGICVSSIVHESLGNRIDAHFADAGEQRVKNIDRPIRVFRWPGTDIDTGTNTTGAPPQTPIPNEPKQGQTNLPHQVSSFLGRDAELAHIVEAIGRNRLVTLTGAGGSGKTRLAIQAARQLIDGYRDGVWLVELAAVSRGDDVAGAVARVADLREEASWSLIDTLLREFAGREMVLVLDNCEQVLDACAELVDGLLKAAPGLRVLTTSREPLGVAGELTWGVPSLDTAAGVALFGERARQVFPGFDPTPEAASMIEAIVERLDGIPLAIELAAARMRMMTPAQILKGLDDRFRLLTGGGHGALARQKTLEASVAWSYDLLEPAEQRLAQRLSVLHGFTLEAAESVGCSEANEPGGVFEHLTRLVDKSLVEVDQSGPEARFRFLETVRQFLFVRLEASGETAAISARHMAHFLTLAEDLAPRLALSDGPDCLARLQAEFHNLEGALSFAHASLARNDLLRFVVALSLFYELRGHFALGWRWFERALSLDGEPSVLRARALWGAAHVCFYGGRYAISATRADESYDMAVAVDDKWAIARALNTIGVLQALSTPVLARESLLQSVEIGRTIKDDWAVADGLKMVTVAWYVLHDEEGGQRAISELEQVGDALGSRFFLAWQQAMVGYFARDRGDLDAAATALDRSLEYSRFVGDPSTGGFAEAWSAALDADRGHIDAGRQRLLRLLASAAVAGSDLAVPEALFALGQIEISVGNPAEALRLVGPHVAELREAGAPSWAAQLSIVRAAALSCLGDFPEAGAALDEADDMGAPLKNPLIDGLIRFERARLALAQGDSGRAEDWLHEALNLQVAAGLRPGVVRTLEAIAFLVAKAGKHAEAARILSAADSARVEMGLVRGQVDSGINTTLNASLREALGPGEFEDICASAASNAGLIEISEYVSRSRGKRKRPLSGWPSLTPTEHRVVSLVVEGLTNPQIAERMFIARGTVKIHLAHIFDKLDVKSRAQLAANATAQGMKELN